MVFIILLLAIYLLIGIVRVLRDFRLHPFDRPLYTARGTGGVLYGVLTWPIGFYINRKYDQLGGDVQARAREYNKSPEQRVRDFFRGFGD